MAEYNPNNTEALRCERLAVAGPDGEPRLEFRSDEEIGVRIRYQCLMKVPRLNIIVATTDNEGQRIIQVDSLDNVELEEQFPQMPGTYEAAVRLPKNMLGQQRCFLEIALVYLGVQHLVYRKVFTVDVAFRGYNPSTMATKSKSNAFIRPLCEWSLDRVS